MNSAEWFGHVSACRDITTGPFRLTNKVLRYTTMSGDAKVAWHSKGKKKQKVRKRGLYRNYMLKQQETMSKLRLRFSY